MNKKRLRQTRASLTLALLIINLPVWAEESEIRFDISPQPLSKALLEFSDVSGVKVFFSSETTRQWLTNGLKGDYTSEQAIQKLLDESGLKYRFDKPDMLTVSEMEAKSLSTESLLAAAGEFILAAAVPVEEEYSGPVEQEDLTVSGRELNGDSVINANTATKIDMAIMDTPVSVQVVPRSVMDDQKSTRIKDALENVSGVRPRSTGGLGTGYILRGFENNKTYRNGLVANGANSSFQTEFDASNIESIEVLKGPASVLYGRSEPGGLININTKKPQAEPYYSVEQQFGSYDFYRTQWDATSAITDDESLLYRFSGSYQSNNSFRDFVSTDRFLLAPSVTWQPTDALDFTVNLEWLDMDYQADFGIPVIDNRPVSIPINRSLSDSNDPIDHQRSVHLGTEMNYHFNENWAVHNRFLASYIHSDSEFLSPSPAFEDALQADNRTFGRSSFAQVYDVESYTTNLDLTGKFKIAETEHNVLVGFDYLRSHTRYHIGGDIFTPTPGLELDIFDPSYGVNPAVFNTAFDSLETADFAFATYIDEWFGIYFQDQITLWDKLHIIGGGRYDWSRTGTQFDSSFATSRTNRIEHLDEGFSTRVGIVYQPIEELSIYGNWTTSFGANNGVSATGSSFDPEIAEQYEIGIKTELFDQRLTTTLAYYHITKENLLTSDLSTPAFGDSTIIGEARSQGIELDVLGQITDQFSLIGSYAYTDARQTKDNNGNEGNRLANVPEHSGSLWAKYDFNGHKALNGFSVGVGGIAVGKREGDLANTFQMPGFVRLDTFAAYSLNVADT